MGSLAEVRTSDLHFFLKAVAQRFNCISIFNSDFKCLHISTPYSNNCVGLMQGLKTLKNFFSWDGSQVVVHNDPQLGCSRSDRIQFLFSADSFHFCIEESFCLPWDFTKKIIKIPPIPVVENHRLNTDLVQTLTDQADCPAGVRDFLLSTIQKIEKFQLDFKNSIKANPSFASKETHKHFLNIATISTLKTIKSKPYASSQIEYELDATSQLRLKTTTSELGVRIDFQGTTNSTAIQLADYVTDSICFNFFADYFQFSDLLNEATYSNFQIAKPTQSLVNSKVFPNKLYSDLCGPDLINQALLDCVSERMSLKSFLWIKPYYQLLDLKKPGHVLEFDVPNSKPNGSMGTAYLFEPIFCSRPIPGGPHVPSLSQFSIFGLDVKVSQYLFRTPKSKESGDFQALLQLECTKPIVLTTVNPIFPIKIKSNKSKPMIVKPSLVINDQLVEAAIVRTELSIGDRLEIKTGIIDFL